MAAKVAIMPWGDVIEDFLGPLGLSVEAFATEMSGGWLFGYAAALRSAGCEACIVCVSRSPEPVRRLLNPTTGVTTVVLPASTAHRGATRLVRAMPVGLAHKLGGPLQSALAWLATPPTGLARALRDEGCTHLVCQEYEYGRFDVASLVGRWAGVRVFATFQGGTPGPGAVRNLLRRRAVRAADGLIIASAAEAARVRDAYGLAPSRIAIIPNPLDLVEWRPADRASARRALGLPADAAIAVCHTRIDVRRKGLDVLIEAWRRIAGRHGERDLRLHLIGTGPDEVELRAEVAARPVLGLLWTSYTTDRAALRQRLAAADLYVMASRHEGFPVAPLEAMACGLPVVLSDAPGCAEILPDGPASGGRLVPAGDVEGLAGALEELLLDADFRRRLGPAARSRAEAYVDLPAVGARLAAFLLGEGS